MNETESVTTNFAEDVLTTASKVTSLPFCDVFIYYTPLLCFKRD